MGKNCVNKFLKAKGEKTKLRLDKWSEERLYRGQNGASRKKWISNILPYELLSRTLNEAVSSTMTLSEAETFYDKFPDKIETPNYGDTWGRYANYIEINNRAIAQMQDEYTKNGILSSIKILPAIPPSAKSWANCVILSQIFPNIYGDGYHKLGNEENSVYGIKLNTGYSKNIIDFSVADKISPKEQFRAFNDLAHFRGIKTGFRMIISEDQIKVAYKDREENFCWNNKEHEKIFIDECLKLVNAGFDSIFFDSAKHIGGYDCEHYAGVGGLPEYGQMQYVLHELRALSGKSDLSFVGEKSAENIAHYKEMGLSAGTAYIEVDDFNSVKYWSDEFKYIRDFAPGAEVSNDNDEGGRSYEDRLNRIKNCLFGFTYASDKLPSFMQMEDIFPLRYDENTHHLMMTNPSYSTDGEPLSHWENLFTKDDGRYYNHQVGEIFSHALAL